MIISSDTTSVGAGSIAPLGQVPATPAINIVLNGGTLQAGAGFTLNANRSIALGPASGSGSGTISVATGATLTYAGTLANNGSGSGNFVKSGPGTLVLTGLAPTYSGTTTINGGTLRLTSSGNPITALSSGLQLELNATVGVTTSGGVVTQWNDLSGHGYNATLVPAAIAGTFTAPIFSSGKVVFGGSNVLMSAIPTGTFTTNGFTEFVVAHSTNSNLNPDEELVSRTGSGPTDQANGNNPGPWDVRGTNVLIGNGSTPSAIQFNGTNIATTMQTQSVLAVSGSATSVNEYLNGVSTLSGGGNAAYGDTGSYLYLGSRADGHTPFVGNMEDILVFNSVLTATQIQAISAYLQIQAGSGTVLPTGTDVSITSGNLDVNGIYQTIGSLNTSSGTNVFLGGGTLTLADNNSSVVSGVISDTGGASSGTGSTLIKQGSGTLTLNGANTFSGPTFISAGTVQLGNALALADSTVNLPINGGLTFSTGTNATTIGGLIGSGNIALQDLAGSAVNLSIGNDNATTSYSGAFSGLGGITKVGTGTLTILGTNTYVAGTTVSAGTLQIGGSASLGSGSYNSAISIASNATLEYSSSLNQTLSGALSGSGALTKDTSSASTVTLSGSSSAYTGTTTVNTGGLRVTGSIANSPVVVNGATALLSGNGTTGNVTLTAGAITPGVNGAIGILTTGNLSVAAASALNFTLGSPGVGSEISAGALTLPTAASSVAVNIFDNAGANGQGSIASGVYPVINYTSLTGGNSASFNSTFVPTPSVSGKSFSIINTGASAGSVDVVVSQTLPLIYQDTFNRNGATLTGTAPTIENGTNATWTAGSTAAPWTTTTAGGGSTSPPPGNSSTTALLPFTPTTNSVYTLSTNVNVTAGGTNWFALGFANSSQSPTASPNGVNDLVWMLERNSSGNLQSFQGAAPNGGGDLSGPYAGSFGTGTLSLVLATGSTLANSTVYVLVNGTQARVITGFNASAVSELLLGDGGASGTFQNLSLASGSYWLARAARPAQAPVGPTPPSPTPPPSVRFPAGAAAWFRPAPAQRPRSELPSERSIPRSLWTEIKPSANWCSPTAPPAAATTRSPREPPSRQAR